MQSASASNSCLVVQFNIDGIEYEGVSKNLTVEIPFLGEYLPSNLENVDRIRQKILTHFIKNKYPVTEEGIQGLERWTHYSALAANECVPYLEPDKPEKETLIWFSLGWWMLYDLFEKLVERKKILEAKENLKNFMDIFREIWTGQFTTVDDVIMDKRCKDSESIHYFLPSLIAFHEAQQIFTKSIPGSPNKLDYFFQEFQQWLEANHFIFQTKLAYGSNHSLETFRSIRPRVCGFHSYLEIIHVAAQVDLTPEIRNHILYAVLQDLTGIAAGIVNDLYSLGRDIKDEHSHNYVLILAKRKKMNLEVAVDRAVDYLHELICDIEKAANQFIKEFEQDPLVIKVYDMIRHIYNGNNTFIHWLDRFGSVAGKVKVRKGIKSTRNSN